MANDDNGGSFTTGFLVGGILGAVVGILLAPRAGSETREDLAERSEDWRIRAEELASRLRARAAPAVDEMRERVVPTLESVRERMSPVVEKVSSRVSPSGAESEPNTDIDIDSSSQDSEQVLGSKS